MDSSERAELIRKGNEAFNQRDIHTARDLFVKADYKAGLVRIGDYVMYEKSLPLLAYGYYKKAGATEKIADIQRRMVGAIGEWLGRDKLKEESLALLAPKKGGGYAPVEADADGMVSIEVNSDLRAAALNILKKSS